MKYEQICLFAMCSVYPKGYHVDPDEALDDELGECCGEQLSVATCGHVYCRSCFEGVVLCVASQYCFKCEYCSEEPICPKCFTCSGCAGHEKYCFECDTCIKCTIFFKNICIKCHKNRCRKLLLKINIVPEEILRIVMRYV
jgi:hypothetical protein